MWSWQSVWKAGEINSCFPFATAYFSESASEKDCGENKTGEISFFGKRKGISTAGQSMLLITPRLWVQSPYGPFTLELDSVIPVGPFQLRIFCNL